MSLLVMDSLLCIASGVDKMAARRAMQFLMSCTGPGPADGQQELHRLALQRNSDHHQVLA